MPAPCLIPDRGGGGEGADRDCGELRQLDLDLTFHGVLRTSQKQMHLRNLRTHNARFKDHLV